MLFLSTPKKSLFKICLLTNTGCTNTFFLSIFFSAARHYLHWKEPCTEGVMGRFNQSVHRSDLHSPLQSSLQRNIQRPP